ncbi:MAG: CHRD domain-containing protein [Chloroflexota bacterium]
MALAFALFGVISVVAAQDTMVEPTEDAMMSHMMMQDGACPEGWAATMRDQMSMMMGMETSNMDMTEEPMMDDDMDSMDMTEMPMDMDMTEMPMMEMTDDMGMSMMGTSCLFAVLSGAAEVPGPGDDDGFGIAFVSIDASTGDVCYEVAVANLTLPAAAMHIHVNAAGVSGDVVVPFPTAPDADGMASGCTVAEVEGLAEAIVTTPAGYYYNVHTTDFPGGAVRGQLMNWHDMMDMDMDMTDMSHMSMDDMMNMVEMMSMGNMDMGMMEMTPEASQGS